jgi:predicted transglutaminase-like cysteine proteinase
MNRLRGVAITVASLLLCACQSPGFDALPISASIAPNPTSNPTTDLIRISIAMPSGLAVEPPSGFVAFCQREPDQCTASKSAVATIKLSPATWHLLEQVNTAWNAAVKPEEDAAHYGRVDYWTIPKDGYGDCEDYALAKRKSLYDLGLPMPALRLTIAHAEGGSAHTVLVVATDRGDYVLDNLNAAILPWAATPYTWIAQQVPDRTEWAFIGSAQDRSRQFASASITP